MTHTIVLGSKMVITMVNSGVAETVNDGWQTFVRKVSAILVGHSCEPDRIRSEIVGNSNLGRAGCRFVHEGSGMGLGTQWLSTENIRSLHLFS